MSRIKTLQIDILEVRLAKAEAERDALRAEVCRLRERVKCFEDAGGVAMPTRIFRLLSELETERMRLAGCGVVAMANTPETATLTRIPKDSPYYSASMGDVEAAVDREIKLRADLEAAVEVLRKTKASIDHFVHDEFTLDDLVKVYDAIKLLLSRMEVRP